jgi:hypothetical protein
MGAFLAHREIVYSRLGRRCWANLMNDRLVSNREIVAQKARPKTNASKFALLRRSSAEDPLVTYCVTTPMNRVPGEKRREQRRRTRLRAGKILDCFKRFLTDATILDRSCGGLRLRLPRDIELPDRFHFFDEEIESIYLVRIAWRTRLVLGVRRGRYVAATPRQIASLRGKFYAIKD